MITLAEDSMNWKTLQQDEFICSLFGLSLSFSPYSMAVFMRYADSRARNVFTPLQELVQIVLAKFQTRSNQPVHIEQQSSDF